MQNNEKLQKIFDSLDYEGFRKLAGDNQLSHHEQVGFPDRYREGYGPAILADIYQKLPTLQAQQKTVLDIGPGCSALAHEFIQYCQQQKHKVLLMDSPEMLAKLPDNGLIEKFPGQFPQESAVLTSQYRQKVDVILCYSVLQYIILEAKVEQFISCALTLLNNQGLLLIGDIPNIDKRNRFFSSKQGIEFHRTFTQDPNSLPEMQNPNQPGKINDKTIITILQQTRSLGCDAYVLPQSPQCPMANRREDILIYKP